MKEKTFVGKLPFCLHWPLHSRSGLPARRHLHLLGILQPMESSAVVAVETMDAPLQFSLRRGQKGWMDVQAALRAQQVSRHWIADLHQGICCVSRWNRQPLRKYIQRNIVEELGHQVLIGHPKLRHMLMVAMIRAPRIPRLRRLNGHVGHP